MAVEDFVLEPRYNKETEEIQICTDRAVDRIINMAPEEKEKYWRMVEEKIARVNRHSYESKVREKQRIAELDRMYISAGFIYD